MAGTPDSRQPGVGGEIPGLSQWPWWRKNLLKFFGHEAFRKTIADYETVLDTIDDYISNPLDGKNPFVDRHSLIRAKTYFFPQISEDYRRNPEGPIIEVPYKFDVVSFRGILGANSFEVAVFMSEFTPQSNELFIARIKGMESDLNTILGGSRTEGSLHVSRRPAAARKLEKGIEYKMRTWSEQLKLMVRRQNRDRPGDVLSSFSVRNLINGEVEVETRHKITDTEVTRVQKPVLSREVLSELSRFRDAVEESLDPRGSQGVRFIDNA